ncbi:retron St85 family RNA-directed DNA polymerase [Pontibacter flavimaris]|uniref:RNA-directed DNA polymerase n=1 Tax=Pontibacter flavimaris TaxID=1797110 RepID=A0A1Q5PCS6_9BACT|nr:retron St85 family RNA-directed DNA polymerase [Pontibacter flavimaris]OKL40004.1 hypothetical protein A3841_16715 [Pontibacter flavimaris]
MVTFDDFAFEIGYNKQILDNYITFADTFYNTFYIAKKAKKKKRIIDSPSKELKAVQRWLLKNYFNEIPVSNSANGFIIGRGIKRNAKFHLKKEYLLTVDIKDFFTSISQKQVFLTLNKTFPDKDLALKLAKVCTFNRRLPQGAPTSPALSNLVFHEVDDKIINFCKTKSITYSRYADDLVFSSDSKPGLVEILPFLHSTLPNHGFKINNSKTKFFSGKGRMAVTGININEGKLTVSKEIKRLLRSQLYNIIIKEDKATNVNQALGYLSFIKDIEPDYHKKILEYIDALKVKRDNY